jgi:hypothetical protein
MTHLERAEELTAKLMSGAMANSDEPYRAVTELLHQALIAASNDELARRREVEDARDRAMRLQAALEIRNQQLEDGLKDVGNIVGEDDDEDPPRQFLIERMERIREVLLDIEMETAPVL